MTLQPPTIDELQDAVRRYDAVIVRGGGTKSPSPMGNDRTTIDMRQLSGITEYSPDECVFTAWAGTPLLDISSKLAEHGQYLPFDPPFVAGGATIGGTVAAGLSGSGRYRYGGVRDFVIGARLVDGDGTHIRSGGKVVKNAAGFLLHHAIVGSLGRFGIVTEITLKVFPSPEARATLCVDCGNLTAALETLREIQSGRFDLEAIDFDVAGTMWLRLAGRTEALSARIAKLKRSVARECEILEHNLDQHVWTEAREFRWVPADGSLIKVPVTPGLILGLAALKPNPTVMRFACGGSVAWIAWSGDLDALSHQLATTHLRGLVVRGPVAGTYLGLIQPNEFEERVRRVLDPHNRFSAAQHPRQ